MSTVCSIIRCNEENDTIVGTSTSCSASCGSRTEVRSGMNSTKNLGTSITCSATGMSASRNWSTSTSCHTISGTGPSSVGNPGTSTIWSTACRCAPTCGSTSNSGAGRIPGRSRFCAREPKCCSQTSPSLGTSTGCALWWRAVASSMATVVRT